jgi:hypothetical protein
LGVIIAVLLLLIAAALSDLDIPGGTASRAPAINDSGQTDFAQTDAGLHHLMPDLGASGVYAAPGLPHALPWTLETGTVDLNSLPGESGQEPPWATDICYEGEFMPWGYPGPPLLWWWRDPGQPVGFAPYSPEPAFLPTPTGLPDDGNGKPRGGGDTPEVPVPEPGTLALVGIGLAGLGGLKGLRRR